MSHFIWPRLSVKVQLRQNKFGHHSSKVHTYAQTLTIMVLCVIKFKSKDNFLLLLIFHMTTVRDYPNSKVEASRHNTIYYEITNCLTWLSDWRKIKKIQTHNYSIPLVLTWPQPASQNVGLFTVKALVYGLFHTQLNI